jgi:ABC-type sugar transport system ATPase subunit
MEMRAEVIKLQRRLGVTTFYVTHDQVEALSMGDRIVVMRNSVIQQIGAPAELYDRPANCFVAAFIGSPPGRHAACRAALRWSNRWATPRSSMCGCTRSGG